MMKLHRVIAILAFATSGQVLANAVSNDVVLAITPGAAKLQDRPAGNQRAETEERREQSGGDDWGPRQAELLASLSPMEPVALDTVSERASAPGPAPAPVEPIEPAFPFLRLRPELSSRTQILSDGRVEFLVSDGTLKENVRVLLAETQGAIPVMDEISDNHLVFSQYRLRGETVLDILDQLVEPYAQSDQVVWQAHMNNAVILKYDRKK